MRYREWLGNTLWRTLMALFPVLARPDDVFAKGVLTGAEYRLYRRLDRRDRAHACAVARRLLTLYSDASPKLRRAALLHDIGKVEARYNPWLRILVALYTPERVAAEPRFSGVRGAWQLKRHHDHYGAALISSAGGDARVAEIVARHHRPGKDAEALRLREADARF
jgi:putative nucleotidyltransferase with HDIG domain